MSALLFLIGYLIGSIPFGLLLAKLAGHGDIRAIGSGNIGATNVLRTGSKKLAAATLLLDIGKGALPILLYLYLIPHDKMFEELFMAESLLVGLGTIIGHCFPIWLKFKGGKGVATTVGVLLAAVPLAGLAACIAWLICAFTSKISSLSALVAIIVSVLMTFFLYGQAPTVITTIIALLVFIRHKENIVRLINGTEAKITLTKKE